MKIELNVDMIANIIVEELQQYYNMMKDNPEDDGITEAIEKVLSHYMASNEYNKWIRSVKLDELAKNDAELI